MPPRQLKSSRMLSSTWNLRILHCPDSVVAGSGKTTLLLALLGEAFSLEQQWTYPHAASYLACCQFRQTLFVRQPHTVSAMTKCTSLHHCIVQYRTLKPKSLAPKTTGNRPQCPGCRCLVCQGDVRHQAQGSVAQPAQSASKGASSGLRCMTRMI